MRWCILFVVATVLAGCTQEVADCAETACPPGPDEDDPPASTDTSTSTDTATADTGSQGPPRGCTAQSPCEVPALDADPQVLMLVNETYASTETAQIRLHNVGQVNYSYSSSQASCQMRIYDDHGHTIDRGVCSDLHTVESIAPGQDVNYTAWGLTECVEDGPWYGGCAESEPVPEGAYHLRLRLCPTDEDGWPDEEGPCTRTGATIQVI